MRNIIRKVKVFISSLWNIGLIKFHFHFENWTLTKDLHTVAKNFIFKVQILYGESDWRTYPSYTAFILSLCDDATYGKAGIVISEQKCRYAIADNHEKLEL